MKSAPIDIAGGSTERETALIIRNRYLKTEKELASLRSINALFNFVTVLNLIGVAGGLLMPDQLTASDRKIGIPPVLLRTGADTTTLRVIVLIVSVSMIYGFNKLHATLRPGHGETWTRPVMLALLAVCSLCAFPLGLMLCLPGFWRMFRPDTAIVLSPTYAGVIADTPDLDGADKRRFTATGLIFIILIGIPIAFLIYLVIAFATGR